MNTISDESLNVVITDHDEQRRVIFEKLTQQGPDFATIEDIGYCFRLILGRAPHAEEWPGHTSLAGGNLSTVVRSYLTSAEFAHRKLLVSEEANQLVETDYPGFKIFSASNDLSVGVSVAGKYYETHVQSTFQRYVQPGMTVLDIGANIGFFSMLSASLVGPQGHVISIEPNGRNVRLLEASRRANGFSQVEIHNVAAHTEAATLVLNTAHSNGTVGALSDDLHALMLSEIVPAQAVDTIVNGRKVDFIKIDVEGAELKALKGAEKTIVAHRPVIVSEFSHTGIHEGGDAYLAWIIERGYRLAVIEENGDLSPFTTDKQPIVDAFEKSGVHHIDIVAEPTD